jgi:hypothetical protein
METTVNLSSDQKLDFLINSVITLQKDVSEMKGVIAKVATLEAKNTALEKTVRDLSLEVKQLKEQSNLREQQLRSNSIRLFNFPGSNDETGLAAKVYDKVLKPILAAAKAKGEISTLPQVGTTIEEVFRVGKFSAGPGKPPPPVLIKFSTSALRLAVLKNKRTSMPQPTDSSKKYVITEDLTTPTYRKLQEIREHDQVARAWTMNGSIWFVRVGENQPSKRVKSIYDDISTIIS